MEFSNGAIMGYLNLVLVFFLMSLSLIEARHLPFSKISYALRADDSRKEEIDSSNQSNEAVATFYVPGGVNKTSTLGTKDRKGNTLIGHRVEDIVSKLQEFKAECLSRARALSRLKDEDVYIGIAADHTDPKNAYGTMISIDSETLTERFKLKEIYEDLEFKDLHVRIVDTGGAFVGNGSLRIDIALASLDMAYAIGRLRLSLVYLGCESLYC